MESRKADKTRIEEIRKTGREERKEKTSNKGSKDDKENNRRKRG